MGGSAAYTAGDADYRRSWSERYYAPHAERRRREARERHARLRSEAFAALGGRCLVCDSTEDLELDHVVPVGRPRPRQNAEYRRIIRGDLSNVQLLCRAHHQDKTRAESQRP